MIRQKEGKVKMTVGEDISMEQSIEMVKKTLVGCFFGVSLSVSSVPSW
jgi:hypothetical protein